MLEWLLCHFRNGNSYLIVFMYSNWCPDHNNLMDAGYQSDACMNIATNQVNDSSLHCI